MILMLMEKLKIEKIILLVHSMGTYICYYMVNYFPEKISGIICMASQVLSWNNGIL